MTSNGELWPSDSVNGNFDLLRVQIETAFAKPAVVVVATSTAADGGEKVARALAFSFARSGYSTLFIDTSPDVRNASNPRPGFWLDEIGLLSTPDPRPGVVVVVAMGDRTSQRVTSQRDVESALSRLRNEFDYVVTSADYGESKSFATSLLTAADAALVSVIKGRRQNVDDAQLASALEAIGSRFLGLVALDPEAVRPRVVRSNVSETVNMRRDQREQAEKELQRRKNAESPT